MSSCNVLMGAKVRWFPVLWKSNHYDFYNQIIWKQTLLKWKILVFLSVTQIKWGSMLFWINVPCFADTQKKKAEIRQRNKSLYRQSTKGKQLRGDKEGELGYEGNLFLDLERNKVSVSNGEEKRAWVKWHEALLSLSFYMIRVTQSVQRLLELVWQQLRYETNAHNMAHVMC